MSRTYAILGTGALGGYYGGQLAKSGRTVHFLLRSDAEHVREQGLRVDTPDGGYAIPPDAPNAHFHGDIADVPPCDVVCVCLKTTHNHLLPELLPGKLAPDGVALTLQNGLHPERDVAAVVGTERVAGGLCFLCSNKVGPGHIQYLDYGYIKLGAHIPGTHGALLEGIAADFGEAGVKCDVVDDLVQARWEKLVWNVPYNGLSVALNMTTDQMMADPDVRQRVVAVMREVAAAARVVDGKTIDEVFIQKMLDNTAKMEPYKTSMMLDYEAGREMEVETILGDALRAARDAGVEPRWMYALYSEFGALDGRAHGRQPIEKACACLVRQPTSGPELLVFSDDGPTQIPKGSIEPTEDPRTAVLRELAEETGVDSASVVQPLTPMKLVTGCGDTKDGDPAEYQLWHPFLLTSHHELPDTWRHRITGSGEDHGIQVRCWWMPIRGGFPDDFHTPAWPLVRELRRVFSEPVPPKV